MRNAWHWIAALLLAACDSSFEDLGPVVPLVEFETTFQAPERAIPGTISLSGTCDVIVGGIDDRPQLLILKIDGTEVASSTDVDIHAESIVSTIGPHTTALECVYEDTSAVDERTLLVVEPAKLTVYLRNFTQDGEPLVHDEGPIIFTVGDQVVVSIDSAVVDVVPDAEYDINADHPDFLPNWARLVNRETGEMIEFRSAGDESSPVYVGSRGSVEVFKIRESDVTSIPNLYHEGLGDSSPFYTVDNLRGAFSRDIYHHEMNRIATESVTVWVHADFLNVGAALRSAIEQLFVTPGPNHISSLTGGSIRSVELVYDLQRPDPIDYPGCIISVLYAFSTAHEEDVSMSGAIRQGKVQVLAISGTGTAVSFFLQVIGLRGTIGSSAADDYVDGLGRPSQFARLALKILYASPPNARF